MDPLEAVLQAIAYAEPQPWFPRAFAAERQIDINQIYLILELLHLEGLITSGPTDPQLGPGVFLTAAGRELLTDEVKLQRLRSGQPLIPGDRGGEVRSIFRVPPRGQITQFLFALNLAVFGYACLLAWNTPGLLQVYALTLPGQGIQRHLVLPLENLLQNIGGVRPENLLTGQWWRLLTCCFAHLGLLHIFMNMMVLRNTGRSNEQMWTPWRYLLIYLIAGWGGSCVAMAYETVPLVGASGALCGLLASEGVWFVLNRRFLPRSAFGRFAGGFLLTVGLMVLISMSPGISGFGHLGGALFGLAAALLLHVQRYGLPLLRWPALIAALLLPAVGYALVLHGIATQPAWHQREAGNFEGPGGELQIITGTLKSIAKQYDEGPWLILDRRPERREAVEVDTARRELAGIREKLLALRERLAKSRHRDPAVVEFINASRMLTEAWLAVVERSEECLRTEGRWRGDQEPAIRARDAAFRAWDQLLD